MILTIEQLLNLINEELNNCVYNNTSDTNGKRTDNRWWTSDSKNLSNSWYNVTTTYEKIIERLEKRGEGVHKFMDKNILSITELNSWVRENQRNISQAARQSTKTKIIFVIEDNYQWDVYPKYGVPVPTLIGS